MLIVYNKYNEDKQILFCKFVSMCTQLFTQKRRRAEALKQSERLQQNLGLLKKTSRASLMNFFFWLYR